MDHAKTKIPPTKRTALQATAQPSTKFVLGDLRIEGEVHDRDKVQEAILRQWQGREFNDVNELAASVVEVGVRNYFQDRGYFKVLAHDPVTKLLAVRDGKQQVLVERRDQAGRAVPTRDNHVPKCRGRPPLKHPDSNPSGPIQPAPE